MALRASPGMGGRDQSSSVAKGVYSVTDARSLYSVMATKLERLGVCADAWYFCLHTPNTRMSATAASLGQHAPEYYAQFLCRPIGIRYHGDFEKDRLSAEAIDVVCHRVR